MIESLLTFLRYGLVFILILVLIRSFIGPSAADRVVAINYAVSLIVMLVLLSAPYAEINLYLDVALVFVLGAFVATLGVLHLLEEGKL